jgi:hypothetical protein
MTIRACLTAAEVERFGYVVLVDISCLIVDHAKGTGMGTDTSRCR